ncbi:MAG: pilus assembly protein PilM [Clostridia bacterium]|nr:pilus assembly protein PilM [Clostridia bacterium]
MFNLSKFLKLSKRQSGVGISLSNSSIRMAEVFFKNNSLVLSQLGEMELSPGCFAENGEIIKPDEIYRALNELAEINDLRTKEVVTAIHGEMVVVRQFFLPFMPEKDLASAVVWEAENYIPFDLNDVEMDFAIAARDEENAQFNILVAAVPRSLVWQYYDLFTSCGIELIAIEVEPVAITRLPKLLLDQHNLTFPTALVDLGDNYTNLVVVSQKDVHFMRTIPMGFAKNDAKKEKNLVELKDEMEYEDKLNEMAFEVDRSLKYLQSRNGSTSVSQILISGIGADSNAERILNGILNLPVETLKFSLQDFKGNPFLLQPKYGVALGLALREVD